VQRSQLIDTVAALRGVTPDEVVLDDRPHELHPRLVPGPCIGVCWRFSTRTAVAPREPPHRSAPRSIARFARTQIAPGVGPTATVPSPLGCGIVPRSRCPETVRSHSMRLSL